MYALQWTIFILSIVYNHSNALPFFQFLKSEVQNVTNAIEADIELIRASLDQAIPVTDPTIPVNAPAPEILSSFVPTEPIIFGNQNVHLQSQVQEPPKVVITPPDDSPPQVNKPQVADGIDEKNAVTLSPGSAADEPINFEFWQKLNKILNGDIAPRPTVSPMLHDAHIVTGLIPAAIGIITSNLASMNKDTLMVPQMKAAFAAQTNCRMIPANIAVAHLPPLTVLNSRAGSGFLLAQIFNLRGFSNESPTKDEMIPTPTLINDVEVTSPKVPQEPQETNIHVGKDDRPQETRESQETKEPQDEKYVRPQEMKEPQETKIHDEKDGNTKPAATVVPVPIRVEDLESLATKINAGPTYKGPVLPMPVWFSNVRGELSDKTSQDDSSDSDSDKEDAQKSPQAPGSINPKEKQTMAATNGLGHEPLDYYAPRPIEVQNQGVDNVYVKVF